MMNMIFICLFNNFRGFSEVLQNVMGQKYLVMRIILVVKKY